MDNYIKTLKRLVEIDDSIIIVGSGGLWLSDINLNSKQPNDIDIIVKDTTLLEEALDVTIHNTSSVYCFSNTRGDTYLNEYHIDIFIGERCDGFTETIIDGITIKHITLDGYLKYCERVMNEKLPHRVKRILLDKYRLAKNYI